MKKINFLLFAMLMMCGITMAQSNGEKGKDFDPMTRAERMTDHMAKEYSLNADQKQKLYNANYDFAQKMAQFPRKNAEETQQLSKEDRKKVHEAMKDARESYENSLKSILSVDQYADYTSKEAARHNHNNKEKF